jgi:prepilin-type N-terminal cleavage/methylation domain-containing protein
MLSNIKKRTEGFTIIEVLIVLAIAGLILLIVFLAVPALQRNSRNTQRKNDVSSVLGAFSEEINNNAGAIPATCDGASTTCFVKNVKLSNYDNATNSVSFTKQTAATAPTAVTVADQVKLYSYAKCSGNTPVATNATSRSVIALYAVESQGATVPQCQES